MKDLDKNLYIKLGELKESLADRALDPRLRRFAVTGVYPLFKGDMVGGVDFENRYDDNVTGKETKFTLQKEDLEDDWEKKIRNPNASQKEPGDYSLLRRAVKHVSAFLKDASEWGMEEPPEGMEEDQTGFDYPIDWIAQYEPPPQPTIPTTSAEIEPTQEAVGDLTIEESSSKLVVKEKGNPIAEIVPEKMDWKAYTDYVDAEDEEAARQHFYSEEGRNDVLEYVRSQYKK